MNFKKRKIIIFLLVLLTGSFLAAPPNFAQGGKIVGKIVDAQTGEALLGVNVQIVGQAIGAATDFEGDYFILNIPPGVYEVRASLIGYQAVVQTGVEVSINHTTHLDYELSETVVELGGDIVVTAERPLVEKDQTSTRHFVSAEEIFTRPTDQLMNILTTLPGIDVNAGGELVVRRGSLDQVAFLIDGMRANNPLNYEPYTNLNLSAIQELEIITGGFNAEYGQAQSGVFNIITKEGGQKLTAYSEFRYIPAGKKHWGTAFYDYSTTRYWENTHARHLQWWVDNPDQWVDPAGIPGNDPASQWTPEQAFDDYIRTHQPLTDYTEQPGYQGEIALGGPTPINNLFFFVSGKYRSVPPITGNSFRNRGTWFDGTAKLTFRLSPSVRFLASGFYGEANTNQGMEYMDGGWVSAHGLENKYAYYDFPGYPESSNDGLTLQLTHVLSPSTFYQIQLSRIFRHRSQSTFPGDADGWELGVPEGDRLRARDEFGNPVSGGFSNLIGLHTTGYYYRGEDKNTDYTLSSDVTSQISKFWQMKAGGDFTYFVLNRFQEAKAYDAIERSTYHPFEGNLYFQNKLEFEGLIMNLGVRYDFYNPNDKKYIDLFDPLDLYLSSREGRDPNPRTEPTSTFSQVSPRIGISHPISDNTVLHFSYGHFFQRANFGDYGEGTFVTGILNTYLSGESTGFPAPYNIGNRDLKPRKTVAYELGIEHNLNGLVVDVTAFYKDITNTIRTVTVFTRSGERYLTAGNGDYGDAKGVEIALRKPLRDYWGGYLNYSISTGIYGRSGDPDRLAPPGSNIQVGTAQNIGDFILYDPARLKFGITLITPSDFSILGGILADVQFSLDYQVYYPHERISNDVFAEAGTPYVRIADKNGDLRIRKEIDLKIFRPAFFIEVRNVFNDKWSNINVVKSASPEDRVNFINSRFNEYPERRTDNAPFPDVLMYRNLPRQIVFGVSISY
jgi:outer membrane receptor protein involved in Fe transport